MSLLLILLSTLISPATACQVTSHRVVYQPGMGTHTAYYCKTNDEEKKQVIELMKQLSCVQKKLGELKILREEAIDLKPHWFTKDDAKKSGPIVEIKLVLREVKNSERVLKSKGYRAIATGRRALLMPPAGTNGLPTGPAFVTMGYDFDDPLIFEQDCPDSGCIETFTELCN